jgi:hypothetical protein
MAKLSLAFSSVNSLEQITHLVDAGKLQSGL